MQAELTGVLRKMYGSSVPEPVSLHVTKWCHNPLTLGAFPILHYGSTLDDLKNLSAPVDNLLFAGNFISFYSTGIQYIILYICRILIHEFV